MCWGSFPSFFSTFFHSDLPFWFAPLCAPHPSFLLPLQRAAAWALASTSDPACNPSSPWALPSSRGTDSSLLSRSPPSPPISSLSLPPPPPFTLPLYESEWSCVLLKGCCSHTAVGKHSLESPTTGPRNPPSHPPATPLAHGLIHQLCNGFKLMSK